jgi:alpha-galactosidase
MGLVASTGAATLSDNFSDILGHGVGTYSWKECYTNATGTEMSVSATLVAHEMAVFEIAES